ncbi:MAG TPA: serine/threonine-protein kinase, partial [Ruminococcaceae bacterium]|nr:serine/threonine-protein kinase [Oscillospiraceae bacterium]
MDNYVGKRLDGRYEVQEIIGVGGMSVVYKAYDNFDDRTVAIKILKDEFLNNEEFKRRFKNESKAIALLSHENIVRVYDVNFGEKLQYIVMEYIDGIDMKRYAKLRGGRLRPEEMLALLKDVLKALNAVHKDGIIHRDISPDNIMVQPDGSVCLLDFGAAKDITFQNAASQQIAKKGFSPPEQYR